MHSYIIYVLFSIFYVGISRAEWSPDPLCPYPSDEVTSYPAYGNCSVYWACYQGSKFLVACDTGLEFDSSTGECSSPEVANCDIFASTSTVVHSTSTSGSTIRSTVTTPESTISDTVSTTRASTISETVSTTRASTISEIPTTTSGSSTTGTATVTSNGTDTPTYPVTSDPQWTPDPDCPWPVPADEVTYFPYPGDCSKYIECFDGNKYIMSCEDGLWWHPLIENCDYPGDYCDASTGTVTVPLSTSTEPPSTSTIEPTTTTPSGVDPRCIDNNSGYWSHPVSCSLYIECFGGNSYEMTCPPGLYFSENNKGCVNSDESECCLSRQC